MNQLPSSLRSGDVNRFPLRLEACAGCLWADPMEHALTGGEFWTIKGFQNLIHFSWDTEKPLQQEPEALALLRVPADYLHFPFLVPKPTSPTPSRSAPCSALPSCVHPSSSERFILWRSTHRSPYAPHGLLCAERVWWKRVTVILWWRGKKKTKNSKINTEFLVNGCVWWLWGGKCF